MAPQDDSSTAPDSATDTDPIHPDPPTHPDIHIEVVDSLTAPGTPVAVPVEQNTQIGEPPRRPAAPGTEFVHQIASGSLDAGDLDALPELPSTRLTRETTRTPRERRIRRLTYGLVTTALLFIIGMSIYELQRLETPEEVLDPERPTKRVETAAPGVLQVSERPASLPEELPDRGKKAPRVLAVEVEQVFADEHTEAVKLGDRHVVAGAVTIVNLWATWCEPCKRELPGFRDIFAAADWGDDVRFVPILLDSTDPVWAFQNYAASMPKDAHFLVDPLQTAVPEALRGAGLLAKDSGLPVTILFDCRRHIRLLKVGELGAADFETLKTQLQQLRGELGASFCKEPPRRPRPLPTTLPTTLPEPVPESASAPKLPVKTSRCGNHDCEAGETEKNCCDCMNCPDTKRCESPRSTPICVDKVDALKD